MGILFLVENTGTRKGSENTEKEVAQILEAVSTSTFNPSTPLNPQIPRGSTSNGFKNSTVSIAISPIIKSSPLPTNSPIESPTVSLASNPTASSVPPSPRLTYTPTPAPLEPAATQDSQSPNPQTPVPQPTGYQIEVVSITSPVKQNTTAEVKIRTVQEAQCGIKVTLPSGSQSTAKGLEPKTADSSGAIAWSWRINWNTKPGIATIEISCAKDGQNFSKNIQMEIIEQ